MENSSVILLSILLGMHIAQCLPSPNSCGLHEISNPESKCQRTCNACRDCGACLCTKGYIRYDLRGACITEQECHKLHLQWLYDAKYNNKKDKFFNCSNPLIF